ncbi:hypothetical protein ACFXPW_19130 [Streptomyces goshikiensis]|uniref:hypothetical protein n=1 Tax=Streptomyces goshikiensis TaxID=1942 RepID=UPI003684ABA8
MRSRREAPVDRGPDRIRRAVGNNGRLITHSSIVHTGAGGFRRWIPIHLEF